MGQSPTRVLLIEDEESDYILTRRMLSSIEGQSFDLEWAPSWQDGIEAIRRGNHDVCLLDYRIGGGDGLELLKESRAGGYRVPIILLTGLSDYRLDVEAMQLGAADFLVKDNLIPSLLERSIRYAIAQTRTLEELRQQQNEIRESELRFRSVVQSASEAIVLADETSRIIFWNKAAEKVFGYEEEEILGFPMESLMPVRYRDAHRLGFERFRVTGKSHLVGTTVELEGLRKDGTDFPMELSLSSWRTGDGMYFTGIIRDITEMKRAEDTRRAKDKAEEANQAKSSFVARMSHELRTPLHSIIGFTSLLRQNTAGNLNAQNIDFLNRILANAQGQLELINGILDLSKIEAGRMDLDIAPASVDSLILEVVKQIEGERRNPEVDIVLHLPKSTRPIPTDARKLRQVLTNLIDNALKFTERGRITISLSARADGTPVCIDVIDTGVGIPADGLNDIFEPFQQVETHNRRFEGTGLGLSISYSLCELLGYGIRVHSQPGRGSRFSVLLSTEAARLPRSA